MRARPLFAAAVMTSGSNVQLHLPERPLAQLHLNELESRFPANINFKTAVLVDCVLGLPKSFPHWQSVLAELQNVTGPYGRVPAEEFFAALLRGIEPLPTRLCEDWARANSVFRSRPYQKNIQTGTYRIWRDLASDPRRTEWSIWPFNEAIQPFTLFEGYPSLMWRQLAKLPARQPQRLPSWLDQVGIAHTRSDALRVSGNPDLADAVMLAASGWILHRQQRLLQPFPGFQHTQEGWIAGLVEPVRK